MAKFLDSTGLTYLWGKITAAFQAKVTASGILKGDGSGGVTAATPGTDYQAPITNPVTGTGTSGYLAKFNGTSTVTSGPQLGSATTTFLRNDGSWATPAGSVTGVKGNSESSYRTGNVNITASNIGAAASSHVHGNITSGGDMTATAAIASGDRIVINDESASKLTSSTITFGSSSTQFLANNGTWKEVSEALGIVTISPGTTLWNNGALASGLTLRDGAVSATNYMPTGYTNTNFLRLHNNGSHFFEEVINFIPLRGKTITADIYDGTTSASNAVTCFIALSFGHTNSVDFRSTELVIAKDVATRGQVGSVTLTVPTYATFGKILLCYTCNSSVAKWLTANNIKINS